MSSEPTQQSFHSVNCRGILLDFSFPKIMGILNCTPDSFSDGGQFLNHLSAMKHAEKMISDGATIIDIGAQSTRPNSTFVTAKEEIRRLGSLISNLKKEFPTIFIALDSFLTETVHFGYNEGIDLVNDISGGMFDENFLETVAHTKLPYILMHNSSLYQDMHVKKEYEEISPEINFYFSKKIKELQEKGIVDIILDPGFGFGKTVEDQHKMIDEISLYKMLDCPLLIGISRKSFIYKPLQKTALDIDEETQKLHLKVLQQGANILRVHDVKSANTTVDIFLAQKKPF